MMFAQANSEHCRHKIFNADWTIDGKTQSHTLFGMIQNTKKISPDNVLSAYSDNAAVIQGSPGHRFYPDPSSKEYKLREEQIHILMKVETHNHPTAMAPFQELRRVLEGKLGTRVQPGGEASQRQVLQDLAYRICEYLIYLSHGRKILVNRAKLHRHWK